MNIQDLLRRTLRRFRRPEAASVQPKVVRELVANVLGSYGTTVVNIGARWGDENAWWRIDPVASVVGFEPDPLECERLNQLAPSARRERYLPLALGARSGEAVLYETKSPACSSLYPPLDAVVHRYPQMTPMMAFEKTRTVSLTRLDDWWESEGRPHVSFLKMDTQGSELDILRGATSVLEDSLGCEVEVEFSPLYRGQPLFTDIDTFLRKKGFALWGLRDQCSYSEQPAPGENGRLYWANAIYLRDYRELGTSDEQWRQSMILAALLEAYGDQAAARSCLKRALAGVAESTEPAVPRLDLSPAPG